MFGKSEPKSSKIASKRAALASYTLGMIYPRFAWH